MTCSGIPTSTRYPVRVYLHLPDDLFGYTYIYPMTCSGISTSTRRPVLVYLHLLDVLFGYTVYLPVLQAMLAELFRHRGHDGFLGHIDSAKEFYKDRAQAVVQCARRGLSGRHTVLSTHGSCVSIKHNGCIPAEAHSNVLNAG